MARTIVTVYLVLALVLVWTVPLSAAVPAGYTPVGPGDIYLALGDSLTTGTEAPENNDGLPGYPATIYADLQERSPDLKYHNLGKDGETSTTMLNGQLAAAVAYINEQRENGQRVGLVTLSIGGNDMIRILPPVAPGGNSEDGEVVLAEFEANFQTILDQLVAALTVDGERQGDLLVMDYYNPYPGLPIPPSNEKLTDIWVPRFNEVIKTEAAKRGIPVAEVATAFEGNESEYLFVDLIANDYDYHPTAAGHRAIADEFLAVSGYIEPFLTTVPPAGAPGSSFIIGGGDFPGDATLTVTVNNSDPLTENLLADETGHFSFTLKTSTETMTGTYRVTVMPNTTMTTMLNSTSAITSTAPVTIATTTLLVGGDEVATEETGTVLDLPTSVEPLKAIHLPLVIKQ